VGRAAGWCWGSVRRGVHDQPGDHGGHACDEFLCDDGSASYTPTPTDEGNPLIERPRDTQLDARFSDPQSSATGWEQTRRALETAELFWISTVRADGRPHVSPLVAVWLDGAIHFCTGAFEQKAANLKSNAHVILTTGCNRWDAGLDLVVEGDAVQVTDDHVLNRLAKVWATKWDGRWHYEARDGLFHHERGEALVYSVTPTKVLAFGKGTFTHTRHRF
jgi:general stress protein 26